MIQQNDINCHNQILGAIETIIYKGGMGNFVIIGLGKDYYIQMAANRGAYEMYCEAVSNYYLDNDCFLDEEQLLKMKNSEWNLEEEQNYSLVHSVDSEKAREELVKLIINTSKDVYRVEEIPIDNISVSLE